VAVTAWTQVVPHLKGNYTRPHCFVPVTTKSIFAAAAAGIAERLAPIEHGRFGALPTSHLSGIGLDLMPAVLAPDDQPGGGGGSVAECHRLTRI
jgi:hypothetical protein